MTGIGKRKRDHINLAVSGDVGFREKTTLFEQLQFVHNALPELALEEIDCSTRILGKRLNAPLLIAGMTGGTDEAKTINHTLASIAERRGYAFGLGSQRPMLSDPSQLESYAVRDVAPTTLLLGNLGVVQAAQLSTDRLRKLADDVGADALCIHLNPAMELVQPEGDHDFRGGLDLFKRLTAELGLPVVAKETGCGMSRSAVRRLRDVGVRHVDVSGAGGTSWVAVETHRASAEGRDLGELFWDWGIPTAASVGLAAAERLATIFATGGIKNGLEVAKAVALGASSAGIARPVLQHLSQGGETAAEAFLVRVERELRVAMALVGARSLSELRDAPRLLGDDLRRWFETER